MYLGIVLYIVRKNKILGQKLWVLFSKTEIFFLPFINIAQGGGGKKKKKNFEGEK